MIEMGSGKHFQKEETDIYLILTKWDIHLL